MRPRSKKNALPLVLLVLPVLTGCATSSRLVVRGDEAAKRGDHGAAAANYDAAFGSESLDKPEVKAEVTRKRNEEARLWFAQRVDEIKRTAASDLPRAMSMANTLARTAGTKTFAEVDRSMLPPLQQSLVAKWVEARVVEARADLAAGQAERAYAKALALEVVAAKRDIGATFIKKEIAPLEADAVRAWLRSEVAKAKENGKVSGADVELASLAALDALARKEGQLDVERADILPALELAADRAFGNVPATLEPNAYPATIARGEKVVGPLPASAPLRTRLTMLRKDAAALHVRRAVEAGDKAGAQLLHWQFTRRYGGAADPRLADVSARLAREGALTWRVTAAGTPCEAALPQMPPTAGGQPMSAVVTFNKCDKEHRDWTTKETRTGSRQVTRSNRSSHQECDTVNERKSCIAWSEAKFGSKTCTNWTETSKQVNCRNVSDPGSSTTETVPTTETVTVKHSKTVIAVEGTAHVTWEGGSFDAPITYSTAFDSDSSSGSDPGTAGAFSAARAAATEPLTAAANKATSARLAQLLARAKAADAANDTSEAEHAYVLAMHASAGTMPAAGLAYLQARYGMSAADVQYALAGGGARTSSLPATVVAPPAPDAKLVAIDSNESSSSAGFALPSSDHEAFEADHPKAAAAVSGDDVETGEQTYAAFDVRVASMQPKSTAVDGTPMALVGVHGILAEPDGFGLAYRGGIAGGMTSKAGLAFDGSVGIGAGYTSGSFSLLAFVNGGADRYGSDEDEGYAVPFAFYASGEGRLRYVVTAPWVIEGGFAYVARATSDPSGPRLRPAGAGPGEEASKEYRGDVRLLFRHWYLGGQYMSFVDASAVGGSIGKLF